MNEEKTNPFNGVGGSYIYDKDGNRIPEGEVVPEVIEASEDE